jgi:lysozyme
MTPLQNLLIKHEGKKNSPYRDSVGKLTIGIGHNLDDKPISDAACAQILFDDISDARKDARTLAWFNDLDVVRQDVVLNMVFNMGLNRFLGFKKMISALQAQDYEMAATQMLDSAWSQQVGKRALELARMMVNGQYPEGVVDA